MTTAYSAFTAPFKDTAILTPGLSKYHLNSSALYISSLSFLPSALSVIQCLFYFLLRQLNCVNQDVVNAMSLQTSFSVTQHVIRELISDDPDDYLSTSELKA